MNQPEQSKINTTQSRVFPLEFKQLEQVIKDRGSKYSVTAGIVRSREDMKAFIKTLKKNKKYARATHNSWAARITSNNQIWETKSNDGETGAGMVILRQIQKSNYVDVIVVVTRWFGGEKLHGDRFRHLVEASKLVLIQEC